MAIKMDPTRPSRRSARAIYAVPVVLAALTVISAALQIMVIPLLGTIGRSLHEAPTAVAWALIGGQLAGAATTPLFGRLGDLVGHRRVLLGIVGLMALGSAIGAVAQSLALLIVARALQGMGAGATALALATVRQVMPERLQHRSIGLISCGAGVGVGLGFIVGGVLHDWHGAFWISLAACAMIAAATVIVVPNVEGTARQSGLKVRGVLDVRGACLLASALVALLLPISEGTNWGWHSTQVLVLFALAAVLLVAFAVVELRRADPLVDLRLLSRAPVLLTNTTSLLFGICMGAGFLLWVGFAETPSVLGYGFGASALAAGVFLLPNAIAVLLVAPIAGAVAKRITPGPVLMTGMGLGIVTFALLSVGHTHQWQLYLGSAAWGTAVALGMVALFLLVSESVPADRAGSALSITTLGQAIGTAVGSAVFTAILSAKYIPHTPVPAASGYTHSFVAAALFAAVALLTATAAVILTRTSKARVTTPQTTSAPAPAGATALP